MRRLLRDSAERAARSLRFADGSLGGTLAAAERAARLAVYLALAPGPGLDLLCARAGARLVVWIAA